MANYSWQDKSYIHDGLFFFEGNIHNGLSWEYKIKLSTLKARKKKLKKKKKKKDHLNECA